MEIVIKKPTIPGAEKPGCEHPPVYRGKPGPQGPAGTVEIAQVVTIEPSDPARVENIGDSTNAKLILYIPKGDPGNRGESGPAVEITEDIIQAIINELDLTPALVGLGNVDNTSDMDKPVSKAQEEALVSLAIEIGDHVGNKNNPHGVTIDQIGAAPAGYGLGVLTNYDVYSDAEIDTVLVDIINGMGNHVFKRIVLSFKSTTNFTNAGGHYYTDIYKLSTNYAMITIKSYIDGGREMQRIWYAGALEPWEWVNPPMVAGVEYRTTERHNGKVVYRKVISIGSFPNTALAHNLLSIDLSSTILSVNMHGERSDRVVQYTGSVFHDRETGSLLAVGTPWSNGYNWYVDIKTLADLSGLVNCWVEVSYTKG